MAAYIALFFSLVSLILMIVILIRFKKLFSTDAIIEKTKAQMNRVIMDVNNNANRDLELINESVENSFLKRTRITTINIRLTSEMKRAIYAAIFTS